MKKNNDISKNILNTLDKLARGIIEYQPTEVDGELYWIIEDKETGEFKSHHQPLPDIVKLPYMNEHKKLIVKEMSKNEYIEMMLKLHG